MPESLDSLKTLYVESLRDLHSAEHQILQALPRIVEASSSRELKRSLEGHLEQTREQAHRLETLFEDLEDQPGERECVAMRGLIDEADLMARMDGDPSVRDAGLITAVQRIEHYEIAGYGCARTFARLLGFDDHAELLQTTLDEEADCDETLTDLAEGLINQRAARAPSRGYIS